MVFVQFHFILALFLCVATATDAIVIIINAVVGIIFVDFSLPIFLRVRYFQPTAQAYDLYRCTAVSACVSVSCWILFHTCKEIARLSSIPFLFVCSFFPSTFASITVSLHIVYSFTLPVRVPFLFTTLIVHRSSLSLGYLLFVLGIIYMAFDFMLRRFTFSLSLRRLYPYAIPYVLTLHTFIPIEFLIICWVFFLSFFLFLFRFTLRQMCYLFVQ